MREREKERHIYKERERERVTFTLLLPNFYSLLFRYKIFLSFSSFPVGC